MRSPALKPLIIQSGDIGARVGNYKTAQSGLWQREWGHPREPEGVGSSTSLRLERRRVRCKRWGWDASALTSGSRTSSDLTANTHEPGWLFLALTVFTILCNLRGSLVTICPSLGECPPMRAGTVFVSDSAFDVQCLVHAPCLFGERQNDRTHFRNLPLAASW